MTVAMSSVWSGQEVEECVTDPAWATERELTFGILDAGDRYQNQALEVGNGGRKPKPRSDDTTETSSFESCSLPIHGP